MSPREHELDAGLAARAAGGDDAAFAALVGRYEATLRGFLRRLAGRDAGDDLAQETFLRAWEAIGRYRGDARFGTWLYAIGWRCFLDATRRERSRARTVGAVGAPEMAAGDPAAAIDLERALARLGERERAALILIDGHGWSQAEAAGLLALPLGTLKHIVTRARAMCRALLDGGDDE